jgi:hypothetical protein
MMPRRAPGPRTRVIRSARPLAGGGTSVGTPRVCCSRGLTARLGQRGGGESRLCEGLRRHGPLKRNSTLGEISACTSTLCLTVSSASALRRPRLATTAQLMRAPVPHVVDTASTLKCPGAFELHSRSRRSRVRSRLVRRSGSTGGTTSNPALSWRSALAEHGHTPGRASARHRARVPWPPRAW